MRRFTLTTFADIYPLSISEGVDARNGSFAWFISSFLNYSDVYLEDGLSLPYIGNVFVDLSSIPTSGRTLGNITQSDLQHYTTIKPTLPTNITTTDTVLFCDPGIQMGKVEVDMSNDGSVLTPRRLEGHGSAPVGNINQIDIAQMLGHGLNGIPWESNVVMHDGFHSFPEESTLGQLTAELLFLPPKPKPLQYPAYNVNGSVTYSTFNQTVYNPQSLSDISSKLNSYTSIAGMTTYLGGSLGNHTVSTTGIYATQRLVVNWPQWFANLSIVLVLAGFVISLTIRDAKKGRELVPLTVATMKRHLREHYDNLEA